MAWMSPRPSSPRTSPPTTLCALDQSSEESGGGHDAAAEGDHAAPAALPPNLRVLVVERNSIVALDVEDMLLRNGAAHVTVANNAAEALGALAAETYQAALVDLHLAAGGSLVVAARLEELGVPFAFVSDYGDRDRTALPPPFAERPILGKPCSERYLASQLAGLLAPS